MEVVRRSIASEGNPGQVLQAIMGGVNTVR
jgi:hypothetical protein